MKNSISNHTKKHIFLLMSGGVDSSVAAFLLKEQGFRVTGVTLQMKEETGQDSPDCGSRQSARLARSAADQLGIEHRIIPCSKLFETEILERCWKDYDSGKTPNPCIWCNLKIKFELLDELMKNEQVDYLSSGHYARTVVRNGVTCIKRGVDGEKDQSYFLFAIKPETIARLKLPLGDYTKSEVREIARQHNLISAEADESQDACFSTDHHEFAESLRLKFNGTIRPGNFIDGNGTILGPHEGIHRYTIGQRRGLKISLGSRAWVSAIHPETASVQLTVCEDEIKRTGLSGRLHQLNIEPRKHDHLHCLVQIRYRSKPGAANVQFLDNNWVEITFDHPMKAITPGQAFVLYEDDIVLGGGWIERSFN